MSLQFLTSLIPAVAATLLYPVIGKLVAWIVSRLKPKGLNVTLKASGHVMSVQVGSDISKEELNRKILEAIRDRKSNNDISHHDSSSAMPAD